MQKIEVVLVSAVAELPAHLQQFTGLTVETLRRIDRAQALLEGPLPPQAVFVDEACGDAQAIVALLQAARRTATSVLIGLTGTGMAIHDVAATGVPVTTERRPDALAAWIAQTLGVRAVVGQRSSQQMTIAIAGAKGGIGKTTTLLLMAEALRRRGLRILIVDGDISNSGLRIDLQIDHAAPSYIDIKRDREAWSAATVRPKIVGHGPSGLDLLLGSAELTEREDMFVGDWNGLMEAVRQLPYDMVLVDTGPDIKKRPYAVLAAQAGGRVLVPVMTGRKELAGVVNALRGFQAMDCLDQCILLFIEPEAGGEPIDRVQAELHRHFERVPILGTVLRNKQLLTLAEQATTYVSPLDIQQHGAFARRVHDLADLLCTTLRIQPPLPKPRPSWRDWLRSNRMTVPALVSDRVEEAR